MISPSTVRLAKPEDKPELVRLFLMAHNENGMFQPAPEKASWYMDRALCPEMIHFLDTGPRGAIGVIGPVGKLEAFAFVIIGEYWYTTQKHLEELIVYVDPQCRRSDHAKALVQWMKDQSDLTGIPLLTGVISNDRTEAKVRLYSRWLPPIGAFFMYNGVGKGSVHGSTSVVGIFN